MYWYGNLLSCCAYRGNGRWLDCCAAVGAPLGSILFDLDDVSTFRASEVHIPDRYTNVRQIGNPGGASDTWQVKRPDFQAACVTVMRRMSGWAQNTGVRNRKAHVHHRSGRQHRHGRGNGSTLHCRPYDFIQHFMRRVCGANPPLIFPERNSCLA